MPIELPLQVRNLRIFAFEGYSLAMQVVFGVDEAIYQRLAFLLIFCNGLALFGPFGLERLELPGQIILAVWLCRVGIGGGSGALLRGGIHIGGIQGRVRFSSKAGR